MAEPRRPRAATAEKRTRLLDAAEQIMLRDGYAAVTSRRVEAEAGLEAALPLRNARRPVRRRVPPARRAKRRAHGRRPSRRQQPLRAWWRLASDPRGTALLVELTAAAEPPRRAAGRGRRSSPATSGGCRSTTLECDPRGLRHRRAEFPPALVAAAVQGLALVIVEDQVRGFRHGPSRRPQPRWHASSSGSRPVGPSLGVVDRG